MYPTVKPEESPPPSTTPPQTTTHKSEETPSSAPPPQTTTHKSEETPSSDPPPPAPSDRTPEAEKWGTHIMGHPAPPSAHPNNQKAAASWSGHDDHPYVQYSPIDKPSNNPIEPVIHVFNSWTNKAENLARDIWQHLKTGSSVSETAWGKLGVTAKAVTGGGFEVLYKQTFNTLPNEKLKRTFACYLSTAAGPVAGTMYLSNIHVAFCSDRPLTYTAPSGQEAWSYYKIIIPLSNVRVVHPVTMNENPRERYIEITTIDEHEFWFMGFVNYDKAARHLQETLAEFAPHQQAAHKVV